MPDAVNNEPTPVGRDMAPGHDASRAANPAGAGGRRISASSFKLLTAKLKGAKPIASGIAGSDIPDLKITPSAGPMLEPAVDAIGAPAEEFQPADTDPMLEEIPALPPVSLAELPAFKPLSSFDLAQPEWEPDPPQTEPEADEPQGEITATESLEAEPPIPAALELPEFRPVHWQSPPPETVPQVDGDAPDFSGNVDQEILPDVAPLAMDFPALPDPIPEQDRKSVV